MLGVMQEAQDIFTFAYDQYSDAIFRHCYIRVRDRELAKDLTQETFMKAWNHYSESEEKIENLKALLYKIATNLIIDHSRRPSSKRTDSIEEMVEMGSEPGEDHSEQLKKGIDAKDSLKVLDEIKEEYREVVLLRYLQDLSLKQTAEILGINENLVSVRLNRALQDLRKHLKNHERT